VPGSDDAVRDYVDGTAPVLAATSISAESYGTQAEAEQAAKLGPPGALCEVWHIDLEEEVFTHLASYLDDTPLELPSALASVRPTDA
jgi:hypothetical protein